MSFVSIPMEQETGKETFDDTIKKYLHYKSLKLKRESSSGCLLIDDSDITHKKEDYRIAICQNGEFVATFDTGNYNFVTLICDTKYAYV